jgi:hypothetical protein
VCPAGSVSGSVLGRCAVCGAYERAAGTACQCVEGYVRDATTRQCAAEPSPGDPDASVAAPAPGGPLGGECSMSNACAPGLLCDIHDTGLCVAGPAGLGMTCGATADCAGTEATYCESFSTRTCQIQGCRETSGRCPGDMACCDFSIIGVSLCVPSDALTEGQCPAPGQLVPRQDAP